MQTRDGTFYENLLIIKNRTKKWHIQSEESLKQEETSVERIIKQQFRHCRSVQIAKPL